MVRTAPPRVVIGGGPAGVELAGTLADITRHTLRVEFRRIAPASPMSAHPASTPRP